MNLRKLKLLILKAFKRDKKKNGGKSCKPAQKR